MLKQKPIEHIFIVSLCVVCACYVSLNFRAYAEPDVKPPEKRSIDARAVAIFDRAITRLKKWRSFSFGADEYFIDSSPPRNTFVSGSLQWPYRLKFEVTDKGTQMQALVGRDRALFWDGKETREKPVKSQAEREREILLLFRSSLGLAFGPIALRAGGNPTRTDVVKSADYARVKREDLKPEMPGLGKEYFRVRLVRTDEDVVRPLNLTYYFNADAHIERLEITRMIDGKLHRARVDFDPLWFGDDYMVDQEGTDRYVYRWLQPKDEKVKK